MKKSSIKIAVASAVATSAFVAVAPSKQVDAAPVNIDKLLTDAQNASNVLKWAISIEGSADGVTQPWDQYNAAKNTLAKAEAALNQLSYSDRLKYEYRLSEPKLQMQRAQGYLDAITASIKINEKKNKLSAAVNASSIENVETAYHEMTAEFRKQTILLDRVYGQSTRDAIRNAVKGPAEDLIKYLKNDVTVHMLSRDAAADIKAGRNLDAVRKVDEAQAILKANVLIWGSSLQKRVDDVLKTLPLQISTITRIDNTTVSVKLNRAVTSIQASEFTLDNGLAVTYATLSKDGLTVTLTTTAQTPSMKYTLKYKGSSASFTVPGSIVPIQIGNMTTQHRDTSEVLALSASFAGTYGYNTIRIDVPTGVKILTINGIENIIAGAKSVSALPDKNGTVTITFTANSVSTAALDKTISFSKMENNRVVDTQTSGLINFYAPAKAGTISNKKVLYVDTYNNYFVTTDGLKYILKGTLDSYRNEGIAVTYDTFKYALNKEDTINGTYQPTSSSSFNIAENYYFVPLALDYKFLRKSGTAGYRMIGNSIELSGYGQPNDELFFFKNSGTYLGKVRMNATTGEWKFKTNVDQNEITDFYIMQQTAGKSTPIFNTWNATTLRVVEGPMNLLAVSEGTGESEDLSNKEATFTVAPIKRANGTEVAQDQVVLSKTAFITLQDADGTKVQFTNNANGTIFSTVTNGFKVKFGPTVEDKIAGTIIENGEDGVLTGPLNVIAIEGVTNAYDMNLKITNGFQIKGY